MLNFNINCEFYPADNRHQNDERAPRARRREHNGVVVDPERAKKGHVVDEADEGVEDNGAKPSDQADENCNER